jgi:hypothetical protein
MAIPLIAMDGAILCRNIARNAHVEVTLRERRGQTLMAMRMTRFLLWGEAHGPARESAKSAVVQDVDFKA